MYLERENCHIAVLFQERTKEETFFRPETQPTEMTNSPYPSVTTYRSECLSLKKSNGRSICRSVQHMMEQHVHVVGKRKRNSSVFGT